MLSRSTEGSPVEELFVNIRVPEDAVNTKEVVTVVQGVADDGIAKGDPGSVTADPPNGVHVTETLVTNVVLTLYPYEKERVAVYPTGP